MPALRTVIFCLTLLAASLAPTAVAADLWTPMTAEEAQLTDSAIDPGAGAEILFYNGTIDDTEGSVAYFKHHMRVKLFNQAGVEAYLKWLIKYDSDSTVGKIQARTYKKDGTVVVLDRATIVDQQIERLNKNKVRAKSVALPGLEPGCVVEIYWEVTSDDVMVIPLDLQFEHPARRIHYEFSPYESMALASLTVNFKGVIQPQDRHGRYQIENTNVPGFKTEPYAPPESQFRSSILVWYSRDQSRSVEEHWTDYSYKLHQKINELGRANRDIKNLAAQLTQNLPSEDAKLSRLYEYCVTSIKNKDYGYAGYTEEEYEKLKDNNSAADTLKNKYGTATDINYLFIALARALDIDARVAMTVDRDTYLPSYSRKHSPLLDQMIVAVRTGNTWRFFDPGSIFVPYGCLCPENEGVLALIADPSKAIHAITPHTPPERSQYKRTSTFTLNAEGELSGIVNLTFTGHAEYLMKDELDDDTRQEQEDFIREQVTDHLPLAEVTALSIEGVRSPTAPLKISYHLRIPQYADRTGQRLLFQPAVFQKGQTARFTAETRANPISFRRNLTIEDENTITLPPGFTLEEASAPSPLNMQQMGNYEVVLSYNRARGFVVYRRQLTERCFTVKSDYYPAVKQAWNKVLDQDNHTLSLIEAAPAAGTTP